jgi:inner membrane protein
MRGYSHALIGATTVIAVNSGLNFIQPHPISNIPTGVIICLGAAILGALVPDIDVDEESSIKHELRGVGTAASFILRLLGVQHRGLTHFGIVALLVTLAGWACGSKFGYGDIGLAFGLGYLSHVVIADAMTLHGVPLLWPLPGQFHLLPKPLRIRTGGPAETLIFIVVLMVFITFLPASFPEYAKLISRILH